MMMNATETEVLVGQIKLRAENFFEVHRLCCSEAVMFVLNKGLNGGLNDDTVLQLGNGFCGGMGGGEGTCGALTGAVSMIGLFLSPHSENGLTKKKARKAAKDLHDTFKKEVTSINCNDLTKEYASQRSARKKNCQKITGLGAEISARIILNNRPELIKQADRDFLSINDTKLKLFSNKIFSFVKPNKSD